ncbi:MAG: ABC transporter ATP-binding protein, partial [Firmicutes bacterium]|nr:ABC transporter ATP-binding protein [Bacillota bacterium]
PLTALNPTITIGKQIAEGLIKQQKMKKEEAIQRTIELLEMVGIPNPEQRIKQYPHEFSGGMRQRVGIAIALACNPKMLIADEPTTALDVTIQAQILELMKKLQQEYGMSIILITHDLGIVADMADKVAIMYAGRIIEKGTYQDIFYNPMHPYTWGLLGSVPRLDTANKTELASIKGTPPDLRAVITGCPFKARCMYEMEICRECAPEEFKDGEEHSAFCWLYHDYAPATTNPITGKETK